jgi:hypothetical protein
MGPLAPILFAALLLLWPALYNGYPLVFSDTGTYLSQAIHLYAGWDRPVFYSLFLFALHLTLTTWPAIIAQAVLCAHMLHLTRRALCPDVSAWWLLPLAGGLSLATALPWFAAQLMPDLFTGLLILALGLLALAPRTLSRGERGWLVGFASFMVAAHQSHLLLAVLLLPVLILLGRLGWRDARRLMIAPALAAVALIGVNLVAHHRAALSPYGNVFLLARVIYDGPGMRALTRGCPRQHWRLCPYLDTFPPTADLFLWRSDGPLARAGGAELVSTEANAIITAALVAEPATELNAVLRNGLRQLARFATGDGLTAWPDTVTPWIHRDFPRWEAATYDAARQTQDRLAVPGWLIALHRAVAIGGVVLCIALLPLAWTRRPIVAGFILLVLLALPLNALITGGLSGPHDRYQSRVMWLPPLLAALTIPALAIPALVIPVLTIPALQRRARERTA